jgi:hypothetical protein
MVFDARRQALATAHWLHLFHWPHWQRLRPPKSIHSSSTNAQAWVLAAAKAQLASAAPCLCEEHLPKIKANWAPATAAMVSFERHENEIMAVDEADVDLASQQPAVA